MTAAKPGDRVHIEYEAEYQYPHADGRSFVVLLDRDDNYHATIPRDAVVIVVAPAVNVGDTATVEVLDRLPNRSIVLTRIGAAQLFVESGGFRGWFLVRNSTPVKAPLLASFAPTVLHVGAGQ